MNYNTNVSRIALAVALGAQLLGCSAGVDSSDEGTSIAQEEIRNGTIASPWAVGSTDPAWSKAVVRVPGCTGAVISPSWVLTARHCNTSVGATITSERPSGNVNRTVDTVVRNPDPAGEAMLLHLSTPFTDIPAVNLTPKTTPEIIGQNVACYGYGAKAFGNACTSQAQCTASEYCNTNWGLCMTPSAELRKATINASAVTDVPSQFSIPANGLGQTLLPGDSGGPCAINNELAGVAWYGAFQGATLVGGESSIPYQRDFIASPSRVQYTVGDFNGDGRKDVIITVAGGSFWYFSTGTGTWNNAYTRTDLPLGFVKYTPGDFNGDGKTDLVITTQTGSHWYYSTGTGTWNTPYSRTDLVLDQVDYIVGDYNGDGREDAIIHNATGAYWYYSTATAGVFTTPYDRTDLPVPKARFTPGDFNGDGKVDVIVSTPTGSYWYYSTGTGTFNSSAYTRTDLPLLTADYTPGDFNGDGKVDLVISTALGSFWYYSTGTGTWNNAYSRTDLTLGAVIYKAADFNGDGKKDLIISNAGGSFWYYSTGTGTWNSSAYNRTDLPWHTNTFAPGDFNGDGKADVIISNVTGSYWYYSTGTGTWNTTAYSRSDLPM